MIVVDASAALRSLLYAGAARATLSSERLHAPHVVDAELANGLRRLVSNRRLDQRDGWAALETWRRTGVTRYAIVPFLERIWELRDNVSAYYAAYVALAEFLGCPLVTADARLTRAPAIRCAVTVVPE
jgi:predicted nucleic acid-binding protein